MKSNNIIVFVDKNLAVAMAANLVGVQKTISQTENSKLGVNWLISTSIDAGSSTSNKIDIRELLPEDLVYYFHDKIPNRFNNLTDSLSKLSAGLPESLIPGNVVSICGKLSFVGFELPQNYSPFEPIDIQMKSCIFHGEECIVGELKNEDYRIPVYFPLSSKYQIAFCHNQPVELTGIVRWTPPYSPGGGRSANLGLRCGIIWLR